MEDYVMFGEYICEDYTTTTEYCPEFEKEQGCSKTTCPIYQKYCEYIKAKEDYAKAERESVAYPLWLLLRWICKRQK